MQGMGYNVEKLEVSKVGKVSPTEENNNTTHLPTKELC